MRIIMTAMAVLMAGSSVGVQSAEAQSRGPYPWCIADGSYGRGSLDCTYFNFRQCIESASGAGGTCVENPVILWQRRGQPSPRQDKKRYDQWR